MAGATRIAGRWIGGGAAVLACWLATALPTAAHPHVWVTTETTVVFEGGAITGFRHKWTFDEFYTTMAIDGLDTNKDGIYSREELAELAKVNIEGLKEFQYFTQARLGKEMLALEDAKDFWLEHHDAVVDPSEPKVDMLPRASDKKAADEKKAGFFSRLSDLVFGDGKTAAEPQGPAKVVSLHFTVPLKQPVLIEAPDFSFAVYDPSFFIAFELARKDPIKLGANAPAGCRVAVTQSEQPVETDERRLNEAFQQQLGGSGLGFVSTKPVKITCGPRS